MSKADYFKTPGASAAAPAPAPLAPTSISTLQASKSTAVSKENTCEKTQQSEQGKTDEAPGIKKNKDEELEIIMKKFKIYNIVFFAGTATFYITYLIIYLMYNKAIGRFG